MRLEMQQRIDELEKRHETEIKALKGAQASQDQEIDAPKKKMAAPAKAIENRGLDNRIQAAGQSTADNGATQSQASVSALPNPEKSQTVAPSQPKSLVTWEGTRLVMKAPKGWEPPAANTPPEMNELWPSRRGSKISRHPLADSIAESCQSAIERAMQQHDNGAKDDTKKGP
ncbi:hypothetical protein CDV31_006284 [Fusarium ambrosium]|uniref:Uncharacterized protein n=1 Tax=Fusarium ambrosium TaxID=131363 RepID=A0A428UE38_9HYPO|nr:hypothetical protein CDV31_006284 [Fusarium ambrosium]